MKFKELIKQLKRCHNDDDYVIAVTWSIEDLCPALATHGIVIEGLEEEASDDEDFDLEACETISKEEANDCLSYIDKWHDCTTGINWDVIEIHVDHWVRDFRWRAGK